MAVCLPAGDRPIEVTLQRAWYALSWPRRLRLVWDLLASQPQQAHLAQLQAMPSEEAMSDVLQQLSAAYPEVRCLLHRGLPATASSTSRWARTAGQPGRRHLMRLPALVAPNAPSLLRTGESDIAMG